MRHDETRKLTESGSAEDDLTADFPAELARVLERYTADLEAGRPVDRARLLAEHPALAGKLEECLAAIDFIHGAAGSIAGGGAGPSTAPAGAPARLGDFRIVREVGRGGMGVVYEAEQVSLGRKVALKVLRFGAAGDEEALKRFQREAETVARLHHTSIVPIFAIGCEEGVNYYAMQFIEGRSLAAVSQQAARDGRPVRPNEVADWGLQAAEALEHAHQRGVIHRDIKPSNLMLDPDGRIWLTDFGLARRLDDVTLSITGLLLGTPRYMSPEQASAAKRPIDHRTDIYSLGATLYELATLKPVFDAETPQGVISQILHHEPVPPRRLGRDLPRDLETIVLKCLEKDPGRRYPAAGALAADLRAFAEGRSIQARRPSIIERGARWLRRNRRSAAVAAASAAVAILAFLVAGAGWARYRDSLKGELSFDTGGVPITVEVLDDDGRPALPAFKAPTEEPVRVLAGSWRARLSHPELMGETRLLAVERGKALDLKADLRERRLWDPLELERRGDRGVFGLLDLGGRNDLVIYRPEMNRGSLQLLRGSDLEPVWEVAHDAPWEKQPDRLLEMGYTSEAIQILGGWSPVHAALDADGDGSLDIIRGRGGLAAISGKDGRVIWSRRVVPRDRDGRIADPPAVFDCNRDGAADLIATIVPEDEDGEPRAAIEAVSGRGGGTLWRREVPEGWIARRDIGALAAAAVQNLGVRELPLVLFAAGSRLLALDPATGEPAWEPLDLGGLLARAPGYADLDGDGALDLLALLRPQDANDQGLELAAFSLAERRPLWRRAARASRPEAAVDYSIDPPSGPDWPHAADLDGDGRAEVAMPSWHDGETASGPGIEVLDGRTGERRWHRWWFAPGPRRRRPAERGPSAAEEFREELGKALEKKAKGANAFLGLFLPSAETVKYQIDAFAAGPDIDGDGRREIFAASADGEPPRLHVTALSGSDGRTLWWRRGEPVHRRARINPLRWWAPGPDGLPLLLVPYDNESIRSSRVVIGGRAIPNPPSETFVLAAGSGRLLHTLPGIPSPRIADLDGDGIPDIAAVRPSDPSGPGSTSGPRLEAFRGSPPAVWKRFGEFHPAADLDGDGLDDLLGAGLAISGRDGGIIWRGAEEARVLAPAPLGDLDGDGAADPIAFTITAVAAFSGRSGAPLWTARLDDETKQPAADGIQISGVGTSSESPDPELRDLDGDGIAEVLRFYERISFPEGLGGDQVDRPTLAVISGRDGAVLWRSFLDEPGDRKRRFRPAIADLDGDGWQDIVAVAENAGRRWELRALGGADGRLLWKRELSWSFGDRWRCPVEPAIRDLDGDGRAEVVVIDRIFEPKDPAAAAAATGGRLEVAEARFRVLALGGADGREAWKWEGKRSGAHSIDPGDPVWGARLAFASLEGIGPAIYLQLFAFSPSGGRGPATEKIEEVVLDASGRTVKEGAPVDLRSMNYLKGTEGADLRAADLDGDGRDELLCLIAGKLRAVRGLERTSWEWTAPGRESARRRARILDLFQGADRAPVVAVAVDGRVHGLDGASGRELWRCRKAALLRTSRSGEPPRWVETASGNTTCRLAERVSAPEDRAPPPPPPPDPRYLRDLPWAGAAGARFFAVEAANALLLLVLPALLLLWAIRWRSWRIGGLLLFYAATAGGAWALGMVPFTLGSWSSFEFAIEFHARYPFNRLWLAGLPPLAFLGLGILWSARRRWLRLGALLGASVLIACGLAAWQLRRDAAYLEPLEHYRLEGWWQIWIESAYYLGLLTIMIWLAIGSWRASRWAWRRTRARA